MATTYLSPGVYVEQLDRGIRPIEAVGTSMPAFVGVTAEASRKRLNAESGAYEVVESRLNKPTFITNWTQYTRVFGEFTNGAYTPDAVYSYFANGGGACYIVSIRALDEASGGVAASASVASAKGVSFNVTSKLMGDVGNNLAVTIADGENETFSMTVGDQTISGLSMKKSGGGTYVGDADFDAVSVSDIGRHTDTPVAGTYNLSGGGLPALKEMDYIGDPAARTGFGSLEVYDDIRVVLCPDLMAGYDGSEAAQKFVRNVQSALIAHCERMRYRFAVLDTPPGLSPIEAREWRGFIGFDSSYAALYYPWIEIPDLVNGGTKFVPPSGHVAGVYSLTDAQRGTHKAPANSPLQGAVGVETMISRAEQDILNPIGVNCIRPFANRGIVIWGARTLSSDGQWRYINVRRLFIFVSASLDQGLQWVVFEPNDPTLWGRVRREVTAFLSTLWGSGALFGASQSEAFYVKCDAELNSKEVRELGQLIVEVGLSPVKPAEFVIFRLSQWAGADAVADDSGS